MATTLIYPTQTMTRWIALTWPRISRPTPGSAARPWSKEMLWSRFPPGTATILVRAEVQFWEMGFHRPRSRTRPPHRRANHPRATDHLSQSGAASKHLDKLVNQILRDRDGDLHRALLLIDRDPIPQL